MKEVAAVNVNVITIRKDGGKIQNKGAILNGTEPLMIGSKIRLDAGCLYKDEKGALIPFAPNDPDKPVASDFEWVVEFPIPDVVGSFPGDLDSDAEVPGFRVGGQGIEQLMDTNGHTIVIVHHRGFPGVRDASIYPVVRGFNPMKQKYTKGIVNFPKVD